MIESRDNIKARVREHLGRVLARLSDLRYASDPQSRRSESLDSSAEVDRESDSAGGVRHVKRPT